MPVSARVSCCGVPIATQPSPALSLRAARGGAVISPAHESDAGTHLFPLEREIASVGRHPAWLGTAIPSQ